MKRFTELFFIVNSLKLKIEILNIGEGVDYFGRKKNIFTNGRVSINMHILREMMKI